MLGCEVANLTLVAVGCEGLAGFTLDSGWLPEGDDEEVQIRFRAQLGGLIDEERHAGRVQMDGQVVGAWPPPVALVLSGCPNGGTFEVAYGIELQITIRYDLEYEGVGIDGEVNIPVPFVGDLADGSRMAGSTTFDPFAFKQDIEARGESEAFTLFEYDVLGLFFDVVIDTPLGDIDVPVSGGFRLDMQGFTEGRYQTLEMTLAGTRFDSDEVSIEAGPPAGGYGAALDLAPGGNGAMRCEVGLQFLPILFLEIADFDFEWMIPVDLHVTLDEDRDRVELVAQADAVLPLPDIRVEPEVLDLGDGAGVASGRFEVHNDGDAPLDVRANALVPQVSVQPVSARVLAGLSASFEVTLREGEADPDRTGVALSTSDPDRPVVTVGLRGRVVAPPDGGLPPPGPLGDGGAVGDAQGARGDGGSGRGDGGGQGMRGDGGGPGAGDGGGAGQDVARQSGDCKCRLPSSSPPPSPLLLLLLFGRRRSHQLDLRRD